jgi:caffeoyl-CoA O-methyltransferase
VARTEDEVTGPDHAREVSRHHVRPTRPLAPGAAAQRPGSGSRPPQDVRLLSLVPPAYRSLILDSTPPTPAQRWLADRTQDLPAPGPVLIPHGEATLLTLLAASCHARRIVEVGTFTGYATLALAMGIPPGGQVVSWEDVPDWALIATEAWTRAGVTDRIDFHGRCPGSADYRGARDTGPAPRRGAEEDRRLDLVVVDSGRVEYHTYWDLLVPHVRPGGIFVVRFARPPAPGPATLSLQDVVSRVRGDDRMQDMSLPYARGLVVARKLSDEDVMSEFAGTDRSAGPAD